MYNKYFLNYENDSKRNLHRYMEKLEKQIDKKIDKKSPYITGSLEKKIIMFLKDKNMNQFCQTEETVLEDIAQYFSGTTRWHHPYVMNNIKTPVNLLSLAVIYNAMMFDPNLAGDTNCGQIAYAELEVAKYMSDLVGWNWKESGGYFTFGGTSTLLNAVKIGVNKALPEACAKGIDEDVFIVSSEQGHSAHADVCNWLGIGKNSCIRVPVDTNYQIDIKKTEEIISKNIKEGKKWIGIIACGGTTIQTIVDPIYEIYQMRERLVRKFELTYKPHIHVDSVVGWVWLFYKTYSFEENQFLFSQKALEKLKKMYELISLVKYADSIGIDFHKTGFCPYSSSMILTKDRTEIFKLNDKQTIPLENMKYGNYSPSSYTLELSRSSTGPLAALTALKLFGYEGYQKLIGNVIEGVCTLVNALSKENFCEVINEDTNGTCVLFIIKPEQMDICYDDLPEGQEADVVQLALYNYKFYLFVLSKIEKKDIDFFVDYSSGYQKVKRGFHMGVLKMQTFNPMLTKEKAKQLVKRIKVLKEEFDKNLQDINGDFVYEPKCFKLKFNFSSYEIRGGNVCLKE